MGKAAAAGSTTVSAEMDNLVNLMCQYGFIVFDKLTMSGHQHSNVLTKEYEGVNQNGTYEGNSECTIRAQYRKNGESITNYIGRFSNNHFTVDDIVTRTDSNKSIGQLKFGYGQANPSDLSYGGVTSEEDKLILGTNYQIGDFKPNGRVENKTVNGRVVLNTFDVSVDTNYVDFAKLQKNFGYFSGQLAAKKASGSDDVTMTNGGSQGKYNIQVKKMDDLAVINTTIDNFSDILTVNFQEGSNAGLLINVDMNGKSRFYGKELELTYGSGSKVSLGESLYERNDNRIYWNFYDSSQPDGQYHGSIDVEQTFLGTFIAPYASLSARGVAGMAVVASANVTGESHRANPYNLGAPVKPDEIDEDDVTLIKTYRDANLAEMDSEERAALLAATEFTVYASDGTTVLQTKSLSWNEAEQRAEVKFDIHCGTSADEYNYVIKETQAPAGYRKSNDVVDCKIVRDAKTGLLEATYRKQQNGPGPANAYSKDFPRFENVRKTAINPQIVLPNNRTYDGQAKVVNLTPRSNPGRGEVTYVYEKKNSDGEYEVVDSLTDAGDYRITAIVAETETHLGGTATAEYTIIKAQNGMRVMDPAESVVRGHSIDLSDNIVNANGTVTYEITGNSYGCTVDENGIFTANGLPGTLVVQVRAAGDDNHLPSETRMIRVTVNDKKMISPTVTLDDWTYGDTNHPTPVVEGNTGNGTVTYTYERKNDDGTYTTDDQPQNAGTYRVTANIGETEEYNGAKATDEFTIHKKEISPAVTVDDWTYGGRENQPRVNAASNPGRGTVTYTYEKKNENGEYEVVERPAGPGARLDAGEYRVTATISETANYTGGTAVTEFTVAKGANGLRLTPQGAQESTVRGKTISLSDNYTNANGPVSYEFDGDALGCTIDENGNLTAGNTVGTVTVKVTAAGDENHEPKTVTITVHINDKKDISPSVSQEDWTYGDENVPTPVVSGNDGNGEVTYTYEKKVGDTYVPVEKPEDAGEYRLIATIAESEDYNGGTAETTFTIDKADITPAVEIEDWTYGGDANEPTLTEGSNPGNGEVTVKYEKKNENGDYVEVTKPENAGEYRVTVTVGETDNYNGGSATTTFTIEKAPNNATVDENEVIENVKRGGHTADLGDKVQSADGKVTYRIDSEDDLGCTIDPETGEFTSGDSTGTVRIIATVAGDENHEPAEITLYVNVIPKNTVALQVEDPGKEYDGKAVEPVITGVPEGAAVTLTYFKDNGDGTTTELTEAPKDAGVYTVHAVFEETDEYEKDEVWQDFTIEPKEVTVSANDSSKVYGTEQENLTATVTGLVEGENESLISYTVSREEGEDVGEYTIHVEGEENQGNYKVTFEDGTFKITPNKDPAIISTEGKDATVTVNTLESDDHSIDLSQFVEGAAGDVTFT
ncbi:MAG: hypothetical protein J5532_07410, partial [Lachnospiraceae bacterium]|nr:hypothetical protein [Lachnospiraceae bacterium]